MVKIHEIHTKQFKCKFLLPFFVFLIGFVLIYLSLDIASLDQGDYSRSISPLLTGGSNYHAFAKPLLIWSIQQHAITNLQLYSSASIYFWLITLVQLIFSKSFHILIMGTISKSIVITWCAIIAHHYCTQLGLRQMARNVLFAALALVFFSAHNVYLLNSFYQEHVLIIALPLLIAGTLDTVRWRRNLCIVAALLITGAAKTQYFYAPSLFFIINIIITILRHQKIDRILLTIIAIIQFLCVLPLAHNKYQQLNSYHSTYLGSYMMETPAQLDALGVPQEMRKCIGVDAFGNKLIGQWDDDLVLVDSKKTCFSSAVISIHQVIMPYLHDITLLPRFWTFASHTQWTAFPFHVSKTTSYIIPKDGVSFGYGNILFTLSKWRELLVTPHYIFISLASLISRP